MNRLAQIATALALCNATQLRDLIAKLAPAEEADLAASIVARCKTSSHAQAEVYKALVEQGKIAGSSQESKANNLVSDERSPGGQITTPTMENSQKNGAPDTIDDDFELSSSDEAELSGLMKKFESSPVTPLKKRKSENQLGNIAKRPREDSLTAMASTIARSVLQTRFGMTAFRLRQEQAVMRLLSGNSAVVVFPTGGGKSLCYQLPALCFKELDKQSGTRQGLAEGGITLVVSPLIALMKDQVDALRRRGISAAVLDSTKTREEYLATVDSMRNGTLDILYCAPERLNNEGFVASMANVRGGVRLLAVDEAHCISEWGHAFRPDYLKVARFAKEIEAERVVCLTATATPQVAKDVCEAFGVPAEGLFQTSSYRSNLRLQAASYQTKKESYPELQKFLKAHPGPTIIYVTLQKQSEELAARLKNQGFQALHYHAGMKTDEKTRCQESFMASNNLIVIATIAFGMGIDKANIRNVIHYDIPQSLEGYSQQIGRAGRDDLDSQCMLYLCAEDLHLRESFARGDLPSKVSVTNLLDEIFTTQPSSGSEPVIEVSQYNQARDHDIKPTVINNIYAQLELRFGLLRATTPKYTKYTWKELSSSFADSSPASGAILSVAKKAKINWHIDVDAAIRQSGLPRGDIVSKLNQWHDDKIIDLQTGGVINVYRIMTELPRTPAKKREIADKLYRELESREQQELQRMQQVMDLITGDMCFSKALAQHFGDQLPNDDQECGRCTRCETRKPVEKVEPPRRDWDSKSFSNILKAIPDRDDARFLARVAFGISSPRVTQAKLSASPIFGSMEDHNFMSLLKAFEKVCAKDS